MEQRELFQIKFESFRNALLGFEETLNIELFKFDVNIQDAIKNGRIQKFEYCTELTWKIIKRFLQLFHGIEAKSPKEAIKEFYLSNKLSEQNYETLLDIIDDRNRLSHIYKEEFFNEISEKLPEYFNIMKKVSGIIANFTGSE